MQQRRCQRPQIIAWSWGVSPPDKLPAQCAAQAYHERSRVCSKTPDCAPESSVLCSVPVLLRWDPARASYFLLEAKAAAPGFASL